ncbi:hypothetical protein DITRI_Ditri03aG0026400 [Diplodiscus trichospermus]
MDLGGLYHRVLRAMLRSKSCGSGTQYWWSCQGVSDNSRSLKVMKTIQGFCFPFFDPKVWPAAFGKLSDGSLPAFASRHLSRALFGYYPKDMIGSARAAAGPWH